MLSSRQSMGSSTFIPQFFNSTNSGFTIALIKPIYYCYIIKIIYKTKAGYVSKPDDIMSFINNAKKIIQAGADILVAGTACFKGGKKFYKKKILKLKK